MTSGELLKYRKGLFITADYESLFPGSSRSRFTLTVPFGDFRFERLAGLSNSHLYRLRQTTTYRRRRTPTTKTRPVQIAIGERRKPHPGGRPGFLRVDSVHQGDLDGEKGIYLVNVVDEVSQYEFVGAVEAISE